MKPRRFRPAVHYDGNHWPIVHALEGAGRSVMDLAGLGKGYPDILVGWPAGMLLMEIKDPAGKDRIEANQAAFMQRWKGPRVIVVRSVREALERTGVRLA